MQFSSESTFDQMNLFVQTGSYFQPVIFHDMVLLTLHSQQTCC